MSEDGRHDPEKKPKHEKHKDRESSVSRTIRAEEHHLARLFLSHRSLEWNPFTDVYGKCPDEIACRYMLIWLSSSIHLHIKTKMECKSVDLRFEHSWSFLCREQWENHPVKNVRQYHWNQRLTNQHRVRANSIRQTHHMIVPSLRNRDPRRLPHPQRATISISINYLTKKFANVSERWWCVSSSSCTHSLHEHVLGWYPGRTRNENENVWTNTNSTYAGNAHLTLQISDGQSKKS